MSRRGDWIQTYTGQQFWPLDPRPEEIHPGDVAHALSHLCRFGGHTAVFYSVAQHSLLVSAAVPPADALWGLLHDAAEAYLVDVPRPVKRLMAGYKEAEAAVMRAVCERFGLPPDQPASVTKADHRLLASELRDLMATPPIPWGSLEGVEPFPGTVVPVSAMKAETAFFERLVVLAGGVR